MGPFIYTDICFDPLLPRALDHFLRSSAMNTSSVYGFTFTVEAETLVPSFVLFCLVFFFFVRFLFVANRTLISGLDSAELTSGSRLETSGVKQAVRAA